MLSDSEKKERNRLASKRWREEHLEQSRAIRRKWNAEHPDVIAKAAEKWAKAHPEKVREIHARLTAKYREKYKGRYRADPEKARKYRKKYRLSHPEVGKAALRRWKHEHPEKVLSYRHSRRTRVKGGGGSFTEQEWLGLLARYVNRCLCCGRDDKKLTADHVIPVSKGGSSNISNIQPLCHSCNSSKGTKMTDYRIGPRMPEVSGITHKEIENVP